MEKRLRAKGYETEKIRIKEKGFWGGGKLSPVWTAFAYLLVSK